MVTGSCTAGRPPIVSIVDAITQALIDAEEEFNALDRAIGDGDHGSNLSRAARTLQSVRDDLAGLSLSQALIGAGRAVVMGVGGASGPLYGTLLMELGKALPGQPAPADWARAFQTGVDATARRGRASEGDKTMIDVLAPAARAFAGKADTDPAQAIADLRAAADAGFAAQRPLRARRGRAAYVGDRSAGANDPGAASARICLRVIADMLEGTPS